jgi:hypothetical protein
LSFTLSGFNAGAGPAEKILLELQKDAIDPGFPDDAQIGANIHVFSVFLQDRRELWTAAGTPVRLN